MAVPLPYTKSFLQAANAKDNTRTKHREASPNSTGANLRRIGSESYSESSYLVF